MKNFGAGRARTGATMLAVAMWNPTRIRWVNDTLETSTGATRVETDQGPAYAKLMGNPEGPQALFCDLVRTRAAAWLGLPTFDFGVVEVTDTGLVEFANGARSSSAVSMTPSRTR